MSKVNASVNSESKSVESSSLEYFSAKWDGNPLNIRGSNNDSTKWLGEKPSERNAKNYMGFIHEKYSFRAAARILTNYNKLYGVRTLKAIITRYAPAADNNHTKNYYNYVASKLGINPDDDITIDIYPETLFYMSQFETGERNITLNAVRGYLHEFGYA